MAKSKTSRSIPSSINTSSAMNFHPGTTGFISPLIPGSATGTSSGTNTNASSPKVSSAGPFAFQMPFSSSTAQQSQAPRQHYMPSSAQPENQVLSNGGRRIWVKKPNSTPTTIIVHEYDLVDDLKQLVLNKYPNSLARIYDPADLLIKLDSSDRLQVNRRAGGSQLLSVLPDNLKSPVSPLSSVSSPSSSSKYLEPDHSVWAIIDQYFPNGMSMLDALIIESAIDDIESGYPLAGQSNSRQSQSTSQHRNHTIKQPQPQQPGKPFYTTYNQPRNQHGNSVHPTHPSFHSTSHVHPMHAGSLSKERSISPATSAIPNHISKSPVSSMHKRSQSIPSQSPTIVSSPSSSSLASYNHAASNNANGHAILLLPKNFSLAAGGGGNSASLKRLSFDETLVKDKPNTVITAKRANTTESTPETESTSNQPQPKRNSLPIIDITKDKIEGKVEEPRNNEQTIKDEKISSSSGKASGETRVATSTKSNSKTSKVENTKKNGTGTSSSQSGKAKSTTDKVLPSISVLVVEDNAINQAILGAFLRKHKMHYQIAKNGQEAVDKWKKGGFHLVIMDLQLPVKSGLEATKEIRYLERINKIGMFAEHESYLKNNKNTLQIEDEEKLDLSIFISPVIIVALTASSNSSADRKLALMAGCNDYLTKPVNLVWLQNKITEWGCMQALINFDGWKSKRLAKDAADKQQHH